METELAPLIFTNHIFDSDRCRRRSSGKTRQSGSFFKEWCQQIVWRHGSKYSACPGTMRKLLKKIGICFFFAQKYHTSMKYVGPVRKELGVRTVFNLLVPADQSGTCQSQVLGVYAEHLVEPMAKVLYQLGVKRACSLRTGQAG